MISDRIGQTEPRRAALSCRRSGRLQRANSRGTTMREPRGDKITPLLGTTLGVRRS